MRADGMYDGNCAIILLEASRMSPFRASRVSQIDTTRSFYAQSSICEVGSSNIYQSRWGGGSVGVPYCESSHLAANVTLFSGGGGGCWSTFFSGSACALPIMLL